MVKTKIWSCTIGEAAPQDVPIGADFPMRKAIEEAYERITGQKPNFCFSGWGAELTETQRKLVEADKRDLPRH